jgi:DNA-binding transcriptional regulator PaaX
MNENDEIREKILKYFYDLSQNAISVHRAKANERMVIMSLQRVGIQRQNISKNIIYLEQTGYLKKEKVEKILCYTISDKGVNHFEGASAFQKIHHTSSINITNIRGVTVVGDNLCSSNTYRFV